MAKPLIIVESPTKARTIAGFLGRDVVVESSMGHIRDLPRNAAEVPEKYKGQAWARLAVNIDAGFEPIYIIPKERKERIKKLKDLLADSDELFLATDEDREGESIAWHLTEVLKPKVPVRRMVFHEITDEAIRQAFAQPREIDRRLVEAQEARRILDRLYGYEVSPVLWRRIQRGLSAGRVQSVAVRIIVDREKERMSFRSAVYWDLDASFSGEREPASRFSANLVEVDGRRIASGKDFDEQGRLGNDVLVLDQEAAANLAEQLSEESSFAVSSVERKPYRRSPYPPFRTSTMQQEAGRKLRFASARTMQVAQRLYENGLITYMRTDSVNLSEAALSAARTQIAHLYGPRFLPDKPRIYTSKVKNAQEAHEAIRPAGERWKTPDQVAEEVGSDEARLYELIWKRSVASQMTDATGESIQVRIGGTTVGQRPVVFATSGQVITSPGFLRAYVEGSDDPEAELDDMERRLPPLEEGDKAQLVRIEATGHETKPPPRFTEASLVRRLEDLGVGRPSTYASIMSTIQDRGYVWKKGVALVPSFTAFAVVTLLVQHFEHLVDYAFTARMEDDLDRIAGGEEEAVPWLGRFYNGDQGLKATVAAGLEEIDAREISSIAIGEDSSDQAIVVRVGRYGPYLQRNDERVAVPDDLPPDELTVDKAIELLEAAPAGDKILGTDHDSGLTVIARSGRFGPYVQLGEAGGSDKPRTASLLKSMSLDDVTLDDALRLLSLPRLVGKDEQGEEIYALNGRYGPYLSRGKDTRPLDAEDKLFTVSLEEALELLAKPARRGRGAARNNEPLRELGANPASGKVVTVRTGRFGPYVTDGEVNASLRTGDDPDTVTLQRAAELLAMRRERVGTGTVVRRRRK